jgi:hypothetical protein
MDTKPDLVTTKARLALGVAFAVVAPVPLAIIANALVSDWHDQASDFSLLFEPFAWFFLGAISALSMGFLGLPAWLLLRRAGATWPIAAAAGSVVGGVTATVLLGRSADFNWTLVLIVFATLIGAIAAGGAWRIAYRRRSIDEFVRVF